MGEPVLLFVWLLVPCLRHPGHCMLRGYHSDGVFSTVQRGIWCVHQLENDCYVYAGLPLVVEVHVFIRSLFILRPRLFCRILLH